MLRLQKIVGGSLNVLADLMPVCRAIEEGAQDEHIQRALEKVGSLLCLPLHGRISTLNETSW
jgi:hypothetical protein